jgi:hypothetical protein
MVCPIPDAVVQKPAPDSPYGEILPFEQQPHSHILVRTAVGAAKMGKGWECKRLGSDHSNTLKNQ